MANALADRVILIEDGRITLDLPVDLPRPRRRGTKGFTALERQVLDTLFSAAAARENVNRFDRVA
ncbi:hypothetical protein BH10PSE7_BH10PSE7_38020 [soil metagenome]